ncbi:Sua5/YciO/YrdC/YwlC family protein, partial [bacterium]|nr:Sua5/YciO/YrdC/YwlC family protein [bacterium]
LVSNTAYKIMRKLFPGPYTFVLPGTRLVPKMMLTKRRTVGIRVPDNNICLMMAQALGRPIVSTTVTIGDEELLNDPYDIDSRLGKALDLVIDGGFSSHDASSVVDLTHDKPVILRAGKGDLSYFE